MTGYLRKGIALLALTATATVGVTCGEPLASSSVDETLLVGPYESGRFYLVDARRGRVIRTSGSVGPFVDALALSPDSTTLYLTAFEWLPDEELIEIDTRSLEILSRDSLAEIAGRSTIGPVEIYGNYALAVSPDGTRLLVNGERRDTVGLVVLDIDSREPVGFLGPLANGRDAIAALPPRSAGDPGSVLVAGSRDVRPPHAGQLYVLDGSTFEVRHVATLVAATDDEWGGLRQVLPAPDAHNVYVLGLDSIYKYDLDAQQVIARARRPIPSPGAVLSVAPDGTRLYLTDPGDFFDYAGSGSLFVFDAMLETQEPIDLRAAAINGKGPVTHRSVVSRDGGTIFVTAGTASAGPLFGPRPSRVLVADARSRTIVNVISLGDWGGGPIYLLH